MTQTDLAQKTSTNPIGAVVERAQALCAVGYFDAAAQTMADGIAEHGPRPWLTGTMDKLRLSRPIHSIEADPPETGSNYADFTAGSAEAYCIAEHRGAAPFQPAPPRVSAQYFLFHQIEYKRPDRQIFRIPNARICIDRSRNYKWDFYVFDADGFYLPEISGGDAPFLLKSGARDVGGPVGLIDDRFTKHNACNFWFDKLPRAFELRADCPYLNRFLLLSDQPYTAEVAQMLQLELVPHDDVNGNQCMFQTSELIISSNSARPAHPAHMCYPHFADPVAELARFHPAPATPPKRLFIDQSNAEAHRLTNSERIARVLAKFGFDIIRLEDHSFAEQRALFANAEMVMGGHGAGLANIIFCKPGTKVIEILPPLYATEAFWLASEYFGLNYAPIIGQTERGARPIDYSTFVRSRDQQNKGDVFLDPRKLKRHLKKLTLERRHTGIRARIKPQPS